MPKSSVDVIARAVGGSESRSAVHSLNTFPMTPEYLTAAQVAQLSGFSVKVLEAYRSNRKGPPFLKIGKNVRYRIGDVRSWLEAGGTVS